MKKNKRLLIFIAIVAIICIIIIARNKSIQGKRTVEVNRGESGTEVTTISGQKLSEVKKYKGLEISDVKIEVSESLTKVTANAYNPTSTDIDAIEMNINIVDKSGNVITSMGGHIDAVAGGQTTPISAAILSEVDENAAYDIQFTEQNYDEPDDNQDDTSEE